MAFWNKSIQRAESASPVAQILTNPDTMYSPTIVDEPDVRIKDYYSDVDSLTAISEPVLYQREGDIRFKLSRMQYYEEPAEEPADSPTTVFPARLTQATRWMDLNEDLGAPVIWKYSWEQVRITDTGGGWGTSPAGLSGFAEDDATFSANLMEIANITDEWVAPGVDIISPSYQYSGFRPRPIGWPGGGEDNPPSNNTIFDLYPVVVLMAKVPWQDGKRYCFSVSNAHDGECE